MMLHKNLAGSRGPVLLAAIACAAVAWFDTGWFAYIPLPLLGGVLVWMGWRLWQEWLFRNGEWINVCQRIDCLDTGSGVSFDPNSETMDTALLEAGTYVIAFNEYVYGDPAIASNFPDRMCFNITANPL